MQRTIPQTASDSITLFMRTYYSLLRTTDAIQIQSLVESYLAMDSSLHTQARDEANDISSMVYTGLRLPPQIVQTEMVLMGQTEDVFEKHDYMIGNWQRVYAPGRRRRMLWDGEKTLAVFLSSRSDVDDLIPMLTAYQFEWNKMHDQLRGSHAQEVLNQHESLDTMSEGELKMLASAIHVKRKDLKRLGTAWGANFIPTLRAMATRRKHFRLRQLSGSLSDYRKATARWWANLRDTSKATPENFELEASPVYFVSSNLHSVANLLCGFAVREREYLLDFLHEAGQHDLLAEYEQIQNDEQLATNEPNFLYYTLKKYMAVKGQEASQRLDQAEKDVGLYRIDSRRGFDVGGQLVHLQHIREDLLDPRLSGLTDFDLLKHSDAIVMNIDYPLGVAAYELLSYVSSRVGRLMGVYIMGKAATLNGRIGDVMVPNVVHDEHSDNTYLYSNCFSAEHISPYMTVGSVLDNQKAVSAFGTFLQNPEYMDVFYEEGYTILEMEAGPYLSAVYESVRPRRHPTNEVVRLYEASLDIGILHYASDTPLSKGHNLGAGSLGYSGIEPTYAAAIAILKRIFQMEILRIKEDGIPEQSPIGEPEPQLP